MRIQRISNKKLVLISILSFSSGLALLNNTDISKADALNNGSSSEVANINQGTSVPTDTQSNTATNSGNNNQNLSSTSNISSKTSDTPQTNSDYVQASSVVTNNNTTFSIPTDTAADHQGTLPGDNGSSWYLDNEGTLNIGAGNVTDPKFDDTTMSDNPDTNSIWRNYKYNNDITSIKIADGAVAGDSLADYFRGLINLKNVDVSNLDVSNTTNFSYMFGNTNSLDSLDISNWKLAKGVSFASFVSGSGVKHINLSGLNFTNDDLSGAFSIDQLLEDINMTGTTASNVTNALTMFSTDIALTNLDLSGFSFSGNIRAMLAEMNSLTSLKVNSNLVLENTGLTNPDGYQGWTDGTNLYSSDDLMKVYGNGTSINPAARISTTWTAASPTSINYTINYYDNSTKNLIGSVTGTGNQGDTVPLTPNYSGYSNSVSDGASLITLPIAEIGQIVGNQVYSFYLKPLDAININIIESEKVGNVINHQILKLIPDDTTGNDTNITTVKNNLKSDRTLDLNETTVVFSLGGTTYSGKLADPSIPGMTIGQVLNVVSGNAVPNPNGSYPDLPSDTTAEQLVDDMAKLLTNSPGSTGSLNLVYEPKATTGGSDSSGDSNSTILKDQKIATTTSIVKLYDVSGKLITNRGLGINTDWKSDVIYNFNGVLYYRVSSDEYVKASDVYVYTDKFADIKVNVGQKGDLVDYLGGSLDRKLSSCSEWKTDKIAFINGKEYYRVSTDEFVPVDEVSEY